MDSNKLIELIESTGHYEARSYSGRGMYGKYCVGVSVDNVYTFISNMLCVVLDTEDSTLIYHFARLLENTSDDTLGYGYIVYWRSMTWPDDMIDDSEDSIDD